MRLSSGLLTIMTMALLAPYAQALPVPVAAEGTPKAVIVIGDEATSLEEIAASVLVAYLEKMTGARLPVLRAGEPLGGSGLLILAKTNPLVQRALEEGSLEWWAEDPGPDACMLVTTDLESQPCSR